MNKVDVIVGSVTGNAQSVADEIKRQYGLRSIPVEIHFDPEPVDMQRSKRLLVVTSSTGMGDIPPSIESLFYSLKDQFPLLPETEFAVVALGDSSYGDNYLSAGKQWQELLLELQAKEAMPLFPIDALEVFDPLDALPEWLEQATKVW